LSVEENDATVVADVFVHNGHADVTDDVIIERVLEKFGQNLPGMQVGVALVEMVATAITRDLELE
jgi:hypothetical protein